MLDGKNGYVPAGGSYGPGASTVPGVALGAALTAEAGAKMPWVGKILCGRLKSSVRAVDAYSTIGTALNELGAELQPGKSSEARTATISGTSNVLTRVRKLFTRSPKLARWRDTANIGRAAGV
jgi:hypothetical protein